MSENSHFKPSQGLLEGDRDALVTRRDFLRQAGCGMGAMALGSMLSEQGYCDVDLGSEALGVRSAQIPPRAKSVIWLFINGGPSHVDTWDYKPALERYDGKDLEGFDKFTGFFSEQVGPLMKSPFEFKQYGQSGAWVSSLFPHLSQHVDKMAFIKSFYSESNNHSPALFMANTGKTQMGYPCVGAWVTYGLGAENQSLPSFVVMSDPKGRGLPKGHASNWSSGFLPGVFQGTWVRPTGDPIQNLKRGSGMTDRQQRDQLQFIRELNEQHAEKQRMEESDLSARIRSFELAYRMQETAPAAFNIDIEPESIKHLYGLDNSKCAHFARQCLTARRMVEKGVRFVQIYSGGMSNDRSWDGHKDIVKNHGGFAAETDQPIAGLLADLDQRGLLDSTLVIWGGEFGRLPVAQKKKGSKIAGRDHNPHCGVYWMAGGGIRGGASYGASDELGHKAVHNKVSVNDLHATILHQLGIDHKKLTHVYNGRRVRLTDVGGHVIHEIIA